MHMSFSRQNPFTTNINVGVAAFGNSPSAIIPAVALIGSIGILCAYGFFLIGKVCAYTGATSYRSAWAYSVSESTSWIPAVSATTKTFLACTAFSMVLGDTFSGLLGQERNPTLVAVTLVILLPLCLLKNLKSLAPFSLMGVLGLVYTAVAMTIRYRDGTYVMPKGELAATLAKNLQPKFGNMGYKAVLSANSLILVCMLSTAYMAHFNAPKFYLELKNNTLARYNQVVSWSFGISIVLMSLMTAVGFLTFGQSCSGLVLNNYAKGDVLMAGSRIAVAVSLVFSYPLAFVGCRDGILDLLSIPHSKRTPDYLNVLTVALLSVLTVLACTLKDVSFLLTLAGATLGNALSYLYPAVMYFAVVKKQHRREPFGVSTAVTMAILGVVFGVIGAKMALDK